MNPLSAAKCLGNTSDATQVTVTIDLQHLAALDLTPRECQVMFWISEGKRNREIAIILGLSPRTVEKHVGHILTKLGVETRTAAVNQCRYTIANQGVICEPKK